MNKFRILCGLMLVAVIVALLVPQHAYALAGLEHVHHALHHGLGEFAAGGTTLAGVLPVGSITEQRYGANPGGTVELYVIDVYDIAANGITPPAPGSHTVTEDIELVAGKAFAKWDFAQDKGSMSSGIKGEIGSQYAEHGVEAFIPRMTEQIAHTLNLCINRRFIVLKKDANGQVFIHGDLLRPCTFETDYKSGTKFTDANGTTVKFSAGTTHLPWLYSGAIPTTPTP